MKTYKITILIEEVKKKKKPHYGKMMSDKVAKVAKVRKKASRWIMY